MAGITPERGYVLVEPLENDPVQMGKTKIVMPDTGKDEPQFARIIAIGKPGYLQSGACRDEGDYEVGNYCYYGKWKGLEFSVQGKKRKLIHQEDIHAVVALTDEELSTIKEKE